MKTPVIIPPQLQKGDVIYLLSTARKIDPADVDLAVKTINGWGFEVQLGKHLLAQHHQFCGTDDQRAEDLQMAINDPNVKAILCFRGGYGTVRIIEKVDFSPLLTSPKWIAGYSDVTALHNVLRNLNIASLHATMPVNYKSNSAAALASFKAGLTSGSNNYNIPTHSLNKNGEGQGKLIGGNLSMIYSLCGTKYDLNMDGCILFLEDLDEYLYHIDRMMQNLKLSGKLERLQGIVVGGMTDMHDNDTPFGMTAEEIILDAVSAYNYPVCFGFPAGHIDDNRTIILGQTAILSVATSGTIFNQ